jgi:5-methylcytosine-specific restriction endonuclease McrA
MGRPLGSKNKPKPTPLTCKKGLHAYAGKKCKECSSEYFRNHRKKPLNMDVRPCKKGLHMFSGRRCKGCAKTSQAGWYAEHVEHAAAYSYERREETSKRTKENRGKPRPPRICRSRLHTFTTDRCKECERLYVSRNRRKLTIYACVWQRNLRRTNPEKVKSKVKARRLRMFRNHGTGCSPKEWVAIVKAYGNRCAGFECAPHKADKLTRDHVIPISQGGPDMAHNIQPLCQPCNSRKRAKVKTGTQYSLFTRTELAA